VRRKREAATLDDPVTATEPPLSTAGGAADRTDGRPREPLIESIADQSRPYIPIWFRRIVDAAAFAAIGAVLFSYFRPGLLVSTTNTTGGDTGAQIYPPWYLMKHLLPRGLLSGWSPDWYAGFPALHFYFPLVPTFQAVLGYVIPYQISFKLGTILGICFLPIAAYLLFRLLRLSFPAPLIAAVFAVGFLFMQSFKISGGNIASSLAGEYSYGLGLGLWLVFIGIAYRVATEDRGRPILGGVVLALAALSHLVPVVMAILFIPALAFWAIRRHGVGPAFLRLGVMFGLAFALTAFWSIPFLARLTYTTNLHWIPIRGAQFLFPREIRSYFVAAAFGVVLAILGRDRRIFVLLVPAAGAVAVFLFLPGGHVWNGRFLPFWYLTIVLTAAYFVSVVATYLMGALASVAQRKRPQLRWIPAGGALVIAVMVVGIGSIKQLNGKPTTFVDNWIEWNYSGYESKASYPQLHNLFDAIRRLPSGRVFWEASPQYGRFGTNDALMTLPYFTGHPTMEGVHYESSLSTPFHFVLVSETADRPFNPIPTLPYRQFDLRRGIEHMRLFDIRYYVTWSKRAHEAALRLPELRHVKDIGQFSIFELHSAQVAIPKYRPVILEGGDWTVQNLKWFTFPGDLDVPLVNEGPPSWNRVDGSTQHPPRVPLKDGGAEIQATMGDGEIRFTTQAIGEPHWIRTSYFPNWKAEGAIGPYLASPSLMMVIPTQSHVVLRYERTWAEWSGLVVSVGAVGLLAVPYTRRRIAGIGNA
jgi:6-pyruvoyl-tetrahydropterin synthase related domain